MRLRGWVEAAGAGDGARLATRMGALVALLASAALGCVQYAAPEMPTYATEEARACARGCQEIYTQCGQTCTDIPGGWGSSAQRAQCFDNCNTLLGDCYTSCD